MIRITTTVIAAFTAAVSAQQITTRAELIDLLGDRIQEENFEGLSVHGGSGFDVPNPFSSDTTPASWGVQPGVSYSSQGTLSIFGNFTGGQDNNIFRATDDLTFVFVEPQAAVGFTNYSTFGNTVTFFSGSEALGSIDFPSSSGFAGWLSPLHGITSVTIQTPGQTRATIDNTTWGFVAPPCPADVAAPSGVLDLNDINTYVQAFVDGEDEADIAPPAEVLDLIDLNLFIASFMAGCP